MIHKHCIYIIQVSQLVILHEDVREGKLIADIAEPVKIVSAAVTNLITVSNL